MGEKAKQIYNLTKGTLLAIAKVGAVFVVASGSPYFLNRAAKEFFKDRSREAARARAKKLREMERRQLISFTELPTGEVRLELDYRGKRLLRQYKLEEMKLQKPLRWDGEWRIVMYDIPQAKRQASNAFREKLRAMGLYRLQRSVWVSPYDCEAELEFLCTVFDIAMSDCVYHFRAQRIPQEKKVKDFFKL